MKLNYSCGSKLISKNLNNLSIELLSSSEEEITNEINRLRLNKAIAHNISTERNIELLDKCAKLWLNKDYSTKHIEVISKITNQSFDLVKLELESTMNLLLIENIEKLMVEELGSKAVLDNWIETSYGWKHRQPRGVGFHNVSGNAFVVIPITILMGLLSKNCNIIKVSGDEPYFAHVFYESLCEIDPTIKDRLSIVYFNSEEEGIYEAGIRNSDFVVHWGGEESSKVMRRLCATYSKHLIIHGSKISFEVIDEVYSLEDTTRNIAKDMVFWEQKACLSPRIIFLNKNIDLNAFSEKLKNSLKDITDVYPKAYLTDWNPTKTIQDRQYCTIKYGLKQDTNLYSSINADYTIISTQGFPEKKDLDRCFYRFIFLCPYENNSEVIKYIDENLKEYLQTMGYLGNDLDFIEQVTLLGVSIVTKPGEMALHAPGTSHDGILNLNEFTLAVSKQK